MIYLVLKFLRIAGLSAATVIPHMEAITLVLRKLFRILLFFFNLFIDTLAALPLLRKMKIPSVIKIKMKKFNLYFRKLKLTGLK